MTARVTDADSFIVMHGEWATYEALLADRGESSCPRIAFLDGVLQLVSPSHDHESIKSVLGDLVSRYCQESQLTYSKVGSWTLKDKLKKAGVEPDECYVFGENPDPHVPDLAIVVIWTSGGITKLEIYRRLAVGEVWFWENGEICVFVLRGDAYVQVERSECLPALDLSLLARLAVVVPTSAAIRELLEALRQGS